MFCFNLIDLVKNPRKQQIRLEQQQKSLAKKAEKKCHFGVFDVLKILTSYDLFCSYPVTFYRDSNCLPDI